MHLKFLALAAAVALAGCGNEDSTKTTSGTNSPAAESNDTSTDDDSTDTPADDDSDDETPVTTGVGIPGPVDPVQTALSEQLFGALISGASAFPAELPATQVLTCADNTVSLRTLDILDALASDAAAGQAALTAPQETALAQAVQDLLLSVGGLLMSLTGSTSCDLDPSSLPLPGGAMPGADQLPLDPAQLQALLTSLAAGDTSTLDPGQLAAQADQLRLIAEQLRTGAVQAEQAPLIPAVLLLVADVVDDVINLLQADATPEGYQAAVTSLVTSLAASLQVLPQQLALPGGDTALPGFDGLGGLATLQDALIQIPVIGAPIAGLIDTLASLQP